MKNRSEIVGKLMDILDTDDTTAIIDPILALMPDAGTFALLKRQYGIASHIIHVLRGENALLRERANELLAFYEESCNRNAELQDEITKLYEELAKLKNQ